MANQVTVEDPVTASPSGSPETGSRHTANGIKWQSAYSLITLPQTLRKERSGF